MTKSFIVGASRNRPEITHPTCAHHTVFTIGECGSSSWSECLWWWRWCPAHQSGPFCIAAHPIHASANWNHRLVLYARCAKYRWYTPVMPNMRTT